MSMLLLIQKHVTCSAVTSFTTVLQPLYSFNISWF